MDQVLIFMQYILYVLHFRLGLICVCPPCFHMSYIRKNIYCDSSAISRTCYTITKKKQLVSCMLSRWFLSSVLGLWRIGSCMGLVLSRNFMAHLARFLHKISDITVLHHPLATTPSLLMAVWKKVWSQFPVMLHQMCHVHSSLSMIQTRPSSTRMSPADMCEFSGNDLCGNREDVSMFVCKGQFFLALV